MRVKELIGKLFAMNHEADVVLQNGENFEELKDVVQDVNPENSQLEIKLIYNADILDN